MRATYIYGPGDVRVIDSAVQPGKVFDRTVALDETPEAYAAMDSREALKVMVKPR